MSELKNQGIKGIPIIKIPPGSGMSYCRDSIRAKMDTKPYIAIIDKGASYEDMVKTIADIKERR